MGVCNESTWQKKRPLHPPFAWTLFLRQPLSMEKNAKVVTIDIPGAFLHANNDYYIIMRMNGTLAKLMVKTDPKLY
jgi:hypothetical protein